ncbi:hypothetical protein LTR36_006906 [Oleoguttula mirabilis]|uniref:Transposase n=1 Tax=Oleoguttula mirabilis TaxID=1507867 RepID=A0AAV9JBE8_9PEZI|nr:hypothetical protein LTR36_006906 [Oleoguttula mirabilis]
MPIRWMPLEWGSGHKGSVPVSEVVLEVHRRPSNCYRFTGHKWAIDDYRHFILNGSRWYLDFYGQYELQSFDITRKQLNAKLLITKLLGILGIKF